LTLIWTSQHQKSAIADAESAYPGECCGAILGQVVNDVSYVSQVIPLNNVHEDGVSRRFRVDSKQLLEVERLARRLGAAVVGFYHSHPDSPAKPSQYDLEHAWEAYSYLIMEVNSGKVSGYRSWTLDTERGSLVEEKVVTNDCVLELSAQAVIDAEEPLRQPGPLKNLTNKENYL
jgi:proteasome lid subunit RPN8/RPN11